MDTLRNMSTKELSRLEAMQGLAEKRLGQKVTGEVLCANTPQTKGRVERVIQTLQDRLEMRLRSRDSREREQMLIASVPSLVNYVC